MMTVDCMRAVIGFPIPGEGLVHDYKRFLQEFEEFRIRARHLFEERRHAGSGDGWSSSGEWMPAVDVYEAGDRIVVTAEIAGVRREDVGIEVLGTVLTLRGGRPAGRSGVAAECYHRMEVASGSFERSFTLPAPVAADRVEAHLRDGVLTVILPLLEPAGGRRISVETG